MNHNNRGIALITVMLVVALAAILATQMSAKLQLQLQRTENISFNQQAYWYAMGAESFAKQVLLTSFAKEPDVVNLGQLWAKQSASYPVEQGEISGELVDLHSCFNLNALKPKAKIGNQENNNDNDQQNNGDNNQNNENDASQKPKGNATSGSDSDFAKQAFLRLIQELNIEDVDTFTAEYMADALTDWLDADSMISSTGGAEDSDYEGKEFPYLAANNYLASVSELRLIEHFTPAIINALKPYVCVLPASDELLINLNTITEQNAVVLQAILDVSKGKVSELISAREADGFDTVQDALQARALAGVKIDAKAEQHISVDSNLFQLTVKSRFADSFFTLNSVLKLPDKQQVQVISRTIGQQ